MDFVKAQFDKLLLACLFVTCLLLTLHGFHHESDSGFVSWLENIDGQVLAALLTLMVGSRMTQRSNDVSKNNQNPPTAPSGPAS